MRFRSRDVFVSGQIGFQSRCGTRLRHAVPQEAIDGYTVGGGTSISAGLEAAHAEMNARSSNSSERQRVIIVLTDGKQNGVDGDKVAIAAAQVRVAFLRAFASFGIENTTAHRHG